MFHPSILERIDKLGYGYEKLYKETRALFDEYQQYFQDLQGWIDKFEAANNRQLELEREGTLPKKVLEERIDKLGKMSELTLKHLPELTELAPKSKVLLDFIFNFRRFLDKEVRKLKSNEKNEFVSAEIVKNLEEKFIPLEYHFTQARFLLDHMKKSDQEVIDIYNSLIHWADK